MLSRAVTFHANLRFCVWIMLSWWGHFQTIFNISHKNQTMNRFHLNEVSNEHRQLVTADKRSAALDLTEKI